MKQQLGCAVLCVSKKLLVIVIVRHVLCAHYTERNCHIWTMMLGLQFCQVRVQTGGVFAHCLEIAGFVALNLTNLAVLAESIDC